jgi:hypothetical protein
MIYYNNLCTFTRPGMLYKILLLIFVISTGIGMLLEPRLTGFIWILSFVTLSSYFKIRHSDENMILSPNQRKKDGERMLLESIGCILLSAIAIYIIKWQAALLLLISFILFLESYRIKHIQKLFFPVRKYEGDRKTIINSSIRWVFLISAAVLLVIV